MASQGPSMKFSNRPLRDHSKVNQNGFWFTILHTALHGCKDFRTDFFTINFFFYFLSPRSTKIKSRTSECFSSIFNGSPENRAKAC